MVCGWAARIRTLIAGTKNQSPAIGRQPIIATFYSRKNGKSSVSDYNVFTGNLKSRNITFCTESYDIHENSSFRSKFWQIHEQNEVTGFSRSAKRFHFQYAKRFHFQRKRLTLPTCLSVVARVKGILKDVSLLVTCCCFLTFGYI